MTARRVPMTQGHHVPVSRRPRHSFATSKVKGKAQRPPTPLSARAIRAFITACAGLTRPDYPEILGAAQRSRRRQSRVAEIEHRSGYDQ